MPGIPGMSVVPPAAFAGPPVAAGPEAARPIRASQALIEINVKSPIATPVTRLDLWVIVVSLKSKPCDQAPRRGGEPNSGLVLTRRATVPAG